MSSAYSFDKNALIEALIEHRALQFGDFRLKSGRQSPYFFNAGLLSSGKALSLLAEAYADVLAKRASAERLSLFGAAYKGIPFVAATAQALWNTRAINAEWGYNRKEAKTHGEGGLLVGADLAGKDVWAIDDVMTAGTALREVAALLQSQNARLAGVVIALDRQEKGAGEISAIQAVEAQFGVAVHSLIDFCDIVAYLQRQGRADWVEKMQSYRDRYGVS